MDTDRLRRTERRYARTRTTRKRDVRYQPEGYGETLIRQCVVCGFIMACLLTICLVKTPFFLDMRQSLKTAISGDSGLDTITQGIADVTDGVDNLRRGIRNIFGGEDYVPAANMDSGLTRSDVSERNAAPTPEPVTLPAAATSPAVTTTTEFRIDEDILGAINARQDFYGEAEKKLTVPEELSPEQSR